MKKLLALFILLLIADAILAVMVYLQQNQQRTASRANLISTFDAVKLPTYTPTTDWLMDRAAIYQTATAETRPPVAWSIEVIQDSAQVAQQDGIYRLRKAPFQLRVRVPRNIFDQQPFLIYLNALDRDVNYQKAKPGSIEELSCAGSDAGCFTFSGLAEPNHSTSTLVLDLNDGTGTHVLYYRDAQDTRWDSVDIQDADVILERQVSKISTSKGESDTQVLPIEEYPGNELFLVFLLDQRAGPVVTEDELQKAVLRFE